MLKIDYIKRKNSNLFSNFNEIKKLNLTDTLNYNPLYSRFFSLNESNFNSINFNNKWYLHEIFDSDSDSNSDSDSKSKSKSKTDIKLEKNSSDSDSDSDSNLDSNSDVTYEDCLINIYNCCLKNSNNNKKKFKDVFFKIAPLINPFKYLIGKYDLNDKSLFNLPSIKDDKKEESIIHKKMCDSNNSSYVDGFFTFLSSFLNEKYNVVNSINFYGSFNSIKNDYKLNIFDDIDMLEDSDFFLENNGILYNMEKFDFLFEEMNKKLKPIKIENNVTLSSIKSFDDELLDEVFNKDDNCVNDNDNDNDMQLIDLNDLKSLSIDINDVNNSSKKNSYISDNSSCSSKTSHTDEEKSTIKNDSDSDSKLDC